MSGKGLEDELLKLLKQKATKEEKEQLESRGITFKNPTKLTLLAAALYFKAAGGDLSAMKEIFAHTGGGAAEGGVVIIDDL